MEARRSRRDSRRSTGTRVDGSGAAKDGIIVTLARNSRSRRLASELALERALAPAPARSGRQALEGLRLRLRDDGPDRASPRRSRPGSSAGSSTRSSSAATSRRSGRSRRRSWPSTRSRASRPTASRWSLSRVANSIVADVQTRIFDQMLQDEGRLLQPLPFVRIHRPAGLHRPVGEQRPQPAHHDARRATR